MGVSLEESGLLGDVVPRRAAEAIPEPSHRATDAKPPATPVATSKIELPERPPCGMDVSQLQLAPTPQRPNVEPERDEPVRQDALDPPELPEWEPEMGLIADSKSDARLGKVVDAWPFLPPTVQSTILALVRAAVGK